MKKKIQIFYRNGIEQFQVFKQGDWIDLRCAEDTYMKKGDFKIIHLGVTIKLPKGYEAIIAPRSSTFKKYGIICPNSIGIIDESYCGPNDEWKFPAYATRDTMIKKDERICQFRIYKHQPKFKILSSRSHILWEAKNRGGFGSTD